MEGVLRDAAQAFPGGQASATTGIRSADVIANLVMVPKKKHGGLAGVGDWVRN